MQKLERGNSNKFLMTPNAVSKSSILWIKHKNDYYYYLDTGLKNTNEYLIFMLTAFYKQLEKVKQDIENQLKKNETVLLPPRQEKILHIIKDHKVVSFDMLRRRFLKVPGRTLRYDLKKLMDKDIISKIGQTKGVYYTLNSLI